jgi:hypothetical protein
MKIKSLSCVIAYTAIVIAVVVRTIRVGAVKKVIAIYNLQFMPLET